MTDILALHEGRVAVEILAALDARRQIPPLTSRGQLALPEAYRIASAVRHLREARGERVVGRKIGFTNTTIWDEYGVHAPIWGDVFDTTLRDCPAGSATFDLSAVVEPRIEPEIAFGLSRSPEPGMDERALLDCVDWVAHGFEIVQSLFPGWRFAASDTVAACGLHGALVLGPRTAIAACERDGWFERLGSFRIALLRNGHVADEGQAANVLGGGPLAALRHLVAVLAAEAPELSLAPGEIVTTGTVTKALPIVPGETWTTRLEGVPLPGLGVRMT